METWEQRLSEAGFRIGTPRRAIMEILRQSDLPLSPIEVLRRGRMIHPRLSLVTVYRTLNLLVELDLVRRIHSPGGCNGYLLTLPGHRHALICEACGRAVEFPGEDDLQSLVERVEASTGYKVGEHLLQLFGQCPACQRGTSDG